MMGILHQPNKLRLFDGVERLITSDEIFREESGEYFLGKITLVCELEI